VNSPLPSHPDLLSILSTQSCEIAIVGFLKAPGASREFECSAAPAAS
jgi:hypothetical protein